MRTDGCDWVSPLLFLIQQNAKPPRDKSQGGLFMHNYQPEILFLCLSELCMALTATNTSVVTGLKGNPCNTAAIHTSCFKVFALATGSILACGTAILAALGLVYKAFFSLKFLFACSESKFIAAFLTDKGLVFVHCF